MKKHFYSGLKRSLALTMSLFLTMGGLGTGGLYGKYPFSAVEVQAEVSSDFTIENGVLTKYSGGDRDVVIPEGVTEIADSAFNCNLRIKSVVIPEGVTKIGESAFASCKLLRSITLPESLVDIGVSAFAGCRKLTSINIPSKCETIQEYAFEYCNNLTTVKMGQSVQVIEKSAFYGCRNLEELVLPAGITHIEENAFAGCKKLDVAKMGLDKCVNLKNLCLSGRNITDISFLSGHQQLEKVNLSNNHITDLSPLSSASKLTSLDLSNNQIGDVTALQNVTELIELDLRENQISDISTLAQASKLQVLYADNNQLQDITSLKNLNQLQVLTLSNNQIEEITSLTGKTSIRTLGLQHNKIADLEKVKALELENRTLIYLAGNLIPVETMLREKISYDNSITLLEGTSKEFKAGNFPMDDYTVWAQDDDGLEFINHNPEVVELARENAKVGTFILTALQAGTATVTIKGKDLNIDMEVVVTNQLDTVDKKADNLPKLECGYDDLAAMSYGNSIISCRDGQLEKVAELKDTDKDYIARIIYGKNTGEKTSVDTLVVDENHTLWSWSEGIKKEKEQNIVEIEGSTATTEGYDDFTFIKLDTQGNIRHSDRVIFDASQGTVQDMAYGLSYLPLKFCYTTDQKLYWTGGSAENVTVYYNGLNRLLYVQGDNISKSTDGFSYGAGVMDVASVSWDEESRIYRQSAQGWYYYDSAKSERVFTDYKLINGNYALTTDGTFCYMGKKILKNVDHFVTCDNLETMTYILREDGTLWKHYGDGGYILEAEYVGSLDNVAEVAAQELNPTVFDKEDPIVKEEEVVNRNTMIFGDEEFEEVFAGDYSEDDNQQDDAQQGNEQQGNTGQEEIILGDVDNDREVTLKDAQLVLKAALKIGKLNGNALKAADADFNGSVELADAQLILKAALKIIKLN